MVEKKSGMMGWWNDMRLNHNDCRLFCSRSRWGRGSQRTAALSERSYRGTAAALNERSYSSGDSRRGVALIIVLGFLSIMVMLAVTFVMHARTERLVADFTLEAQRGRQIVRTALNAAMYEFSTELYEANRFMMAPLEPVDYSVFTSERSGGQPSMGRLRDDDVYLMDGEAYDWIPARYRTTAVSNKVADAEWVMVREGSGANSRILGRYAYAVFDMSGGIDANFIALADGVAGAGNSTNRPSVRQVGMGTDANPLLAETIDPGEFKRLRTGWHGFDTLSEIIRLTDGHYIDGQTGFETGDTPAFGRYPTTPTGQRWRNNRVERFPALNKTNVADLVPYSLSSIRGLYNFASGRWETGEVMACDQMTDWTDTDWVSFDANILFQVRDQLVSRESTLQVIKDYISTNRYPQGTDYPNVKNNPMFNEIGMSFELEFVPGAVEGTGFRQAGGGRLFLNVEVQFEVWYPFPSAHNAPSGTYAIQAPSIGGGFAPSGSEDIWLRCRLRTGSGPANVTLMGGNIPDPLQITFAADFNNGNPIQAGGTINYRIEVQPDNPDVELAQTDTLQVPAITVNRPIVMRRDGQPVGEMRFAVVRGMNLSASANPREELWYEVDDPRLGYDPDRWQESDNNAGMGEINPSARRAGYESSGGPGLYMYCRNGPMVNPGEFGFIPTGRPWETIDLCTAGGARLLSRLVATSDILTAINTGPYNTFYTNATINPNTTSTNVLKAAFAGLTRREVPNAPDLPLNALSGDDAELLAGSMIDASRTKQIVAEGGAFMYGSDWVRVPAMQRSGQLATAGLNKNERESLIRNTWGLFNPNNTMFTVLVIAQAIKEGPGRVGVWDPSEDMITGERRAVALVWRDPTPIGTNPRHHEMYVRMFKLLDE